MFLSAWTYATKSREKSIRVFERKTEPIGSIYLETRRDWLTIRNWLTWLWRLETNLQGGWQVGVEDSGRANVSVQGLLGRKSDVGDETGKLSVTWGWTVFLFCSIQEEFHLHMRAICFTPTVWNVNLTPKDPCRNTQNHIWPNIWASQGPVKLTHNITYYREDWGGPNGLAGITSALLWPAQDRVFCWVILETLHKRQILFPKQEVGAVTRRKKKGYQGAAGPFLQRVSLDHLLLWG